MFLSLRILSRIMILIVIAEALFPQIACAAPRVDPSTGSVALVLSMSPSLLNIPSIELYRRVSEVAEEGKFWGLATMRDVSSQMPKPQTLSSLGVVPVFDRRLLTRVHPEAVNMSPGYKVEMRESQAKGESADVIAPVQAMLDTLALKGAVIVDCVPQDSRTVNGCALYYYDRAEGKILASTRKYFRTGVHDASNWSYSLVAGLADGMQASTVAKEKAKLNALLKKGEDRDEELTPAVEFKAFGRSLTGPVGTLKSLPGVSLFIGAKEETYSFGLEVAYSQAKTQNLSTTYRVSERALLMNVTAEARALDSLVWDLGLAIGFSQRLVEASGGDRESLVALLDQEVKASRNSLDSRSIELQMAPGLMWELSRRLSFGTELQVSRYVPLSTKAQGTLSGAELNHASLGVAFRFRSVF